MKARIFRRIGAVLVGLQLLASAAGANPARLGSAADMLRRVPAEQRGQIERLVPRMTDADVSSLVSSLNEYDRHSTFWNSLKWATSAGAVLTPLFPMAGIVGAGKLLGGTALGAMAWGGPAIWAIGAAAGAAGWVGLHYYNHTKHWHPKALARLSSTIGEIESRIPADPARTAPQADVRAMAPADRGMSLLGVGGR